jgi:hypothetical protein
VDIWRVRARVFHFAVPYLKPVEDADDLPISLAFAAGRRNIRNIITWRSGRKRQTPRFAAIYKSALVRIPRSRDILARVYDVHSLRAKAAVEWLGSGNPDRGFGVFIIVNRNVF